MSDIRSYSLTIYAGLELVYRWIPISLDFSCSYNTTWSHVHYSLVVSVWVVDCYLARQNYSSFFFLIISHWLARLLCLRFELELVARSRFPIWVLCGFLPTRGETFFLRRWKNVTHFRTGMNRNQSHQTFPNPVLY